MCSAVILNDTRSDDHFGCDRVMRTLVANLERRGVTVIGTSPVRSDWSRNATFLEQLKRSDLIVINGEGTLHHGAKAGARLLGVLDHPDRAGKPVALVNALYQENPPEWGRWMHDLALVSVRDSRSGEEIVRLGRPDPMVVLDFSLFEEVQELPSAAKFVSFGDSVSPTVSSKLLELAGRVPDAVFLPIRRSRKTPKPDYAPALQALRRLHAHVDRDLFRRRHRYVQFSKDEPEFLSRLAGSRLHVTGRFHGACLSVALGVPFLGIRSNSWKIETLLKDLGLSARRLVAVEDLATFDWDSGLPWSAEEKANLSARLTDNRTRSSHLFDELARLASEHVEVVGRRV